MTRPLRIQVPGGTYHVTARGNRKLPIYADDSDRRCFLYTVEEVLSRFDWECLAYCLMGNHYHLVVTIARPNLARGMRHLNGVYAQRFKHRHDGDGPLFARRYGSVLVERDAHMLEVLRYVARNPVRAGLSDRPERWWWSSHRAVLGLDPGGFVAVGTVLALFGDDPSVARRRYAAFVDDPSADVEPAGDEPIAGSRQFLETHLPAHRPSPEIPRRHWHARRPALTEIFEQSERDDAIAAAYRDHNYTMKEIAESLGCHYATVSRRLRAWEDGQMS